MQVIKNWQELSKVKPNDKYKIEVDLEYGNGWIAPIQETEETKKDYFKHHRYLSTHTFYGKTGTPTVLQEFGWNLLLDNWDKEGQDV